MSQLPIHPALFFALYIVPLLLVPASQYPWVPFRELSLSIAVGGTLLVHLFWVFQTLTFVTSQSGKNRLHQGLFFLSLLFLLGTYLGLFAGVLKTNPLEGGSGSLFGTKSPLVAGGFIGAFVAFLWVAARALCEAEERGRVSAHNVVGTFLQLFYVVVGAPFIYRRLKAL